MAASAGTALAFAVSMRHRCNSFTTPVRAAIMTMVMSSCGAHDVDPIDGAPLLGTTAPTTATFSTTRTVTVPIGSWLLPQQGDRVHLRIALDEEGTRVVFLGRVQPSLARPLRVTLPTAASHLHYEIYAETGPITRGSWKAPEQEAL